MASSPFVVSENADGTCDISARGAWSDELLSLIASVRLRRLSLWAPEWPDYALLSPVADKITDLRLNAAWNLKSAGLESLVRLKTLFANEPISPPVDWNAFQELEEATILWDKGYKPTLFSLPRLRKLVLSSYSETSCREIANAKSLVSLDIRQGSLKSLEGIQHLSDLRVLSLAYIRSLSDVSNLRGMLIDELNIEACPKITDPLQMLPLPAIRRLKVEKVRFQWPNFDWVGLMPNLREVVSTAEVARPNWDHVFQNKSIRRFSSGTVKGYHISDEELRRVAADFDRSVHGIVWYPPKSVPCISLELTAPMARSG